MNLFKWIKTKIINICKWNNNLFTIYIDKNIKYFIPGQFIKLALLIKNKYVYRYYSFLNSYNDDYLEFYIYKVNNGYFSKKLFNLNIGDYIYISNISYGNFTLLNIINKKINYLWMICTNTGISPFLSILFSNILLLKNKFKHIFLIYGIKYLDDLIYINKLFKLLNIYNINFFSFLITLSKENINFRLPFFINGRVSNIELYNKIQKDNKIIINNKHFFMLCGNKNMIKDMSYFLKENYNFVLNKNFLIESF